MTDLRELARELRANWRGMRASLIAVSPYLNDPYPDDTRWTPWTRFIEHNIKRLDAPLRECLDVLERLAAEQEAEQASLLRVRSHADWLVGFLSVYGPVKPFRERAYRKARELLAEITAAQAASSEPGVTARQGAERDARDAGVEADASAAGGDPSPLPGSLGAEADAALIRRAISELGFALSPESFEIIGGNALAALGRLLAGKAAG